MKNSEIWAPAFFKHNSSFIATVCDFQLRIRCAYTFVVNQLPDSNSFHPPKPRAAKALLTFICDVFLLLKMGSTVGILDPIIEVFG